jgi:predicted O-methyltransferase YrrM
MLDSQSISGCFGWALIGLWICACDSSRGSPEAPSVSDAPADPSPQPEKDPTLALPAPVPQKKREHFDSVGPMQTTVIGDGDGPYRFTAAWHLKQVSLWQQAFADVKGKSGLRYLEVGAYEGRSLLWMAENVLTDPASELVAIDIFVGDYEENFDHNVSRSEARDRIHKRKGRSSDILRDPSLGMFDIIYIDASHVASDVLIDAVLAWPRLRVGGLLVFDDYGWTGRKTSPLPPELLPRMAIDAFMGANRYEVELLHIDYQVVLRRVANPCEPRDYCTPVGQYQYYWRDYELRQADGTVVEISAAERGLVEAIARTRSVGPFDYGIPAQIRESAPFQALVERLDLELPSAAVGARGRG